LRQRKPKTMKVEFKGDLSKGVTAKDMILKLIGQIGTAGGTGYVMEYTGESIRKLSMEGRMTICNMSIEGGARAGMIAPDQTTYDWMEGRNKVPKGKDWENAIKEWEDLKTDKEAKFDSYVEVNCDDLEPFVSWGTNPSQVLPISAKIPSPDDYEISLDSQSCANALEYMGLQPGTRIEEIFLDRVFIGSCTNARITDLRSAAQIIEGKKVNANVRAQVMPGSTLTKIQAEKEGLDAIFKAAGFEWRESGCSMCLGMNPDIIAPGERCASTSNRNFEGRQGKGGRTHLVSPEMAAAAAIEGHFVDVRDW